MPTTDSTDTRPRPRGSGEPPEAPEPRALRADAARNRERILAAAEQVFSEHGLDASIADVARVAGVGKATVFRSYPTKDDLIAAIACDRIRWIEELVTAALEEPDAWGAFERLLADLAHRHATDLTHLQALARETDAPLVAQARAAANAALRRLMDAAKAQGAMRADATPDDIRTLFQGITHAMPPADRHDPAAWARWAQLIASALRAAA
jgi:AcrR family transcriptional regulator